ncbi:MAG: PQQ-binding-like beta-propeller repeat protein [Planctomycetales bacterium]|nr:PQQ-binding-like beta-propeller repeat protein [Planctomycetales bacterium]
MNHRSSITLMCLLLAAQASAAEWPRFLGPHGDPAAAEQDIPVEWSSKKNVRWQTELPGKGASSPVVAGGRVYVTCYTGYGIDADDPGNLNQLVRHLIAYDRSTGDEVWRASIAASGNEDPYEGFINQHGYASSSPVVDGGRVYTVFGKSGLYAYTTDGEELWRKDLGQKSDPAKWGDGASPCVVGDTVVVNATILGNHIVGFNKETGEQLWSVADPNYTNSWATPAELVVDGQPQVLLHVPGKVLAIDAATGDTLWTAESPLNDAACGSIAIKDGVGYLMGGRAGDAMAVKVGGSGDVTDTHTVWRAKLRSGIATPLALGDNLYWTSGGAFYAASRAAGKYVYRERLPRLSGPTGGFPNADYASPVAVGEKIIQFTRNGESYVLAAGDEFRLIAHNPPFEGDEGAFSATPAVSDGELFVRSEGRLYCLSKRQE